MSPVRPATGHTAAREWEMFIPMAAEWINLNQRLHWAPKAKRTRSWRMAGHIYARQANLPRGLGRVQITAHVMKSTARQYDAHNLIPTAKAVIDGLVDYGLIEDDTNQFLTGPDMRQGGKGIPGIRLEIKEVPA